MGVILISSKTGKPYDAGSKWISPRARKAIYERDNHCCLYCGSSKGLTLDHVIARHNGGELRAASNLITACVSCNSEKQDLTVRQYAAFRRGKYGESQAGLIPRIVAAIGHRNF